MDDASPPQLASQQHKVLVLVAKGCANKEIAIRLGISEQTVKWHVSRMLRRFNVPNRAALVHVALNPGEEGPRTPRSRKHAI